jgi:hypothetical protein
MRVGSNAWSMQYHVEVEPDTVHNWAAIPEYKAALEKTMGPGAADSIKRAADAAMPGFLSNSEMIYRNFRRATA